MSVNQEKTEIIKLDGKVYEYIDKKHAIEIQIIGDGNCFFRCLSEEIVRTQENYAYYQTLIYNYIVEKKKIYKNLFKRRN